MAKTLIGRFLRLVRRHWLLSVLVVLGLTLRILAWTAYQPSLLYIDSFHYLENLRQRNPTGLHPLGYVWLLNVLLPIGKLLPIGGLQFVAALQHLVGIVLAVALYALALRHRVPRWLASVVAATLLLDAYQLQIEETILSEIWLQAVLVGLMWVLLGPRRVRWWQAGLAGLLLGAAMITRTIAIVAAVPVAVFLITCGGLRLRQGIGAALRPVLVRLTAAAAGLAIVLVSYASYYHAYAGEWRISGIGTHVLYGRAATLAECDKLPMDETMAKLCPREPVDEREGVNHYTHKVFAESNFPGGELPEGTDKEALGTAFGKLVLRHQPLDFVRAAWTDFAKNFAVVRETSPRDVPIERWQFQTHYPRYDGREAQLAELTEYYDGMQAHVNTGPAAFLRAYQLNFGYTPGPALALFALAGSAATLGLERARRGTLKSAAMVITGSALALLIGASAFMFSWRYLLPGLVLLPLGGAIGLTALFRRAEGADLDPFPDPVDRDAVAAFDAEYGDVRVDGLVVLIAAYNEENGIGAVLDDMPQRCGDRGVSVLIVVDGAADRTAEIAAEHGAYVADVARNRGQGAALRLGYHLARRMGSELVVTTDADGQYDNRELPRLVAPLLDDTADFVTGSRRLGSEEADSRMRWLGVRVFATVASILTRQRITDTSFGFRAMRTEQVCALTLREPQYQASELLLGMLAGGARLRELPLAMRLRTDGASKKGNNFRYGANYARVMISTWWREHVRRGSRRR
ncbi:MAG: glycosyltransferase family 2 protein [Propionibacteriaceae bacterium]